MAKWLDSQGQSERRKYRLNQNGDESEIMDWLSGPNLTADRRIVLDYTLEVRAPRTAKSWGQSGVGTGIGRKKTEFWRVYKSYKTDNFAGF